MTILSSREVNHDIGRAKKAAAKGPVIITDRGKPSHVLLSMDDYRRLTHTEESVVDALASEDTVDLEQYLNQRSFPCENVIFD